jgi:hypothetical protein
MHSPVEIRDLRDIETYIEFVARFGEQLTAKANSERWGARYPVGKVRQLSGDGQPGH